MWPWLARLGFLRAYYWATPLFALLDPLAGLPLRAAALPDGAARLGYYLLCLGCAVIIQVRERYAPVVGMVESSTNILLLVLSVYLPIIDAVEAVDGTLVPAMTPLRLGSLALSGFVLYRSFLLGQLSLGAKR